jgi:DNA-binding NarL/FixJ family response regulator
MSAMPVGQVVGEAGDGHAAVEAPRRLSPDVVVMDLHLPGLVDRAEIARRLVVSDKTVRNHVSNVFTELQVAGRAEAVARARDAGLGAPG